VNWPQIVGPVVANHSAAEAVRDGTLIVAADSAAWAHELQMRQRELLEAVAKHVGAGVITSIHFRTGRRRGGKRGVEKPAEPRPVEMKLGGKEQKQIAEAAAQIEDADLRVRAERALTALARMTEWRNKTGWQQCQKCGRWQRSGKRWCSSCTHIGGRRRWRWR
jgi:predicted nucleic acid-binding Zn ribbon protein